MAAVQSVHHDPRLLGRATTALVHTFRIILHTCVASISCCFLPISVSNTFCTNTGKSMHAVKSGDTAHPACSVRAPRATHAAATAVGAAATAGAAGAAKAAAGAAAAAKAHLLAHVVGPHVVAVNAQVGVVLLQLPRLDLQSSAA